jgi:hypothetical protein
MFIIDATMLITSLQKPIIDRNVTNVDGFKAIAGNQ